MFNLHAAKKYFVAPFFQTKQYPKGNYPSHLKPTEPNLEKVLTFSRWVPPALWKVY